MNVSLNPVAAAGSLLINGGVFLSLVTAAPEPLFGTPCAACGGFNSGPKRSHRSAGGGLPTMVVAEDRPVSCPNRPDVDRPASLEDGEHLPSVRLLPVVLCARIDRRGTVVAIRMAGDSLAAEREREAVEALRELRFAPATARGTPVSSWLQVVLSGDPEPPLIL